LKEFLQPFFGVRVPAAQMDGDMSSLETSRGPVEYAVLDGDPDQPPPVFLHEVLGCVAMWGRFPARLAATTGRRALVYSRHSYGHSGPPRLPRPVGYMHQEAHEVLKVLPGVLERLEMSEPVVVGHSDGASTALLHAAVHPVTAAVAMARHPSAPAEGASEPVSSYFVAAHLGLTVPVIGVAVMPADGTLLPAATAFVVVGVVSCLVSITVTLRAGSAR
jgi:pimeloyl-ACP methyl ester carboxylesterase